MEGNAPGAEKRIKQLIVKVKDLKAELDSLKKQENVVLKSDLIKIRDSLNELIGE